jgi:hypothetical protein
MQSRSKSKLLSFFTLLRLTLILVQIHGCGGVVVGNPHGVGKGSTAGSIRLSIRDATSRKFSKVLFNIKAVQLVGEQQTTTINLPATKQINAVQSAATLSPDSIIDVPAQVGTYRGLTLEFDQASPISLVKADGKLAKIAATNSTNFLKISDGFAVAVDGTVELNMYIDLDNSFKPGASSQYSPANAIEPDGESYEFTPIGSLERGNVVRNLSGDISGGAADMVCVYLLRSSAVSGAQAATLGTEGPKLPGTNSDTNILLPPVSFDAADVSGILADRSCDRAFKVQFGATQRFFFKGLLPREYAVVARSGQVDSAVTTVFLKDGDKTDLVLALTGQADGLSGASAPSSAALVKPVPVSKK